ncbi:unnamed protein product, partial [Polarella glacialis]
ATFGFISNLATEHTRQIQSDTAADVEEAQTSQAAAGALDPQSLCTESQVTFTVPPMTPFPFHVRFRVDVDGRKGPWENPLTWEGGYFFSPRMKGGLGNVTMPPPVLLSVEWERSNIEGKWTWQEQVARPEEGELRLFTLAGLTPSVATTGVSGWLVGKAGQGLFGTRT